jgi:hypothetical protein
MEKFVILLKLFVRAYSPTVVYWAFHPVTCEFRDSLSTMKGFPSRTKNCWKAENSLSKGSGLHYQLMTLSCCHTNGAHLVCHAGTE